MRQYDLLGRDLIIFHPVNNILCVGNGFRVVGKKFRHFLWRFQVFLSGIMHPGGIVEVFPCIEADQDAMGIIVFGMDKMHIIGGDQL